MQRIRRFLALGGAVVVGGLLGLLWPQRRPVADDSREVA